jgi:hypothetical protein
MLAPCHPDKGMGFESHVELWGHAESDYASKLFGVSVLYSFRSYWGT